MNLSEVGDHSAKGVIVHSKLIQMFLVGSQSNFRFRCLAEGNMVDIRCKTNILSKPQKQLRFQNIFSQSEEPGSSAARQANSNNSMEPKSKDQVQKSYCSHESHIKDLVSEKDQNFFHLKNQDCAGYRLGAEALQVLDPFLDSRRSWLTVGDNNGFEANYLAQKGQSVVASDISDALLAEAKAEGIIVEYSKQNVEALTYQNNSFDYVTCKEAFHHFPRPYMGLYEMIRVSQKAAILVAEPIDILSKISPLVLVKNLLDSIDPLLINKLWKNRFSFESVGNYVYKISEREVEKIAMGIGLPCIAFKPHNLILDYWNIPGILDVPFNRQAYVTAKRQWFLRNLVSKLGVVPYNQLCCVVFKEIPEADVVERMRTAGYKIIKLPPNPYLKQI